MPSFCRERTIEILLRKRSQMMLELRFDGTTSLTLRPFRKQRWEPGIALPDGRGQANPEAKRLAGLTASGLLILFCLIFLFFPIGIGTLDTIPCSRVLVGRQRGDYGLQALAVCSQIG